MADRRPLAAAVNTYGAADPAEVRAFITQERKTEATPPAMNVELNSLARTEFATRENERVSARTPSTSKPSMESLTRSPKIKPTRLQPVGLIPVTIRLRPEIAGALKRASLVRQLNGEEVFTQQELVESALEPWLVDEGYISGKA
jgi:hypothetical protein